MADIRTTKGDIVGGKRLLICKICNKAIEEDDGLEVCADCMSPFHKSCWINQGGCGNTDCKSYVSKKKEAEGATSRYATIICEKAKASLLNKNYKEARELYSNALGYEPSNEEALVGLVLADCSVTSKKELAQKGLDLKEQGVFKFLEKSAPVVLQKLLEEIEVLRQKQNPSAQEKTVETRETKPRLFETKMVDGGLEISSFTNKEINHVVIPSSVTSIGKYAFWGCKGLTSIEISNSVTTIGDSAFYGCTQIKELEAPTTALSSIPKDSLQVVTINGGETIGSHDFYKCTGLTSVTIPNSVTKIGSDAFWGCTGLTSIVIPNSVTKIGDHAFWGCTGLTIYCEAESQPSGWDSAWNSDNYPVVWDCKNNDVAEDGKIYLVEDGVIYSIYKGKATVERRSKAITTANIKEKISYKGNEYTVTAIGPYVFQNCTGLTSVVIPNSVTSIGKNAFRDCTNLTSVTIGNSVTSIGYEAFRGCTGLTSVVIPNSVTSIGEDAFLRCKGLTSVTIGNSVTAIGNHAFMDCTRLTSVIIPNSVTFMGGDVFSGCSKLTIYCEAERKLFSGWDRKWNSTKCLVVWNCKNNDVADDGKIYLVEDGVRYSIYKGKATVERQSEAITTANIKEKISYKGNEYTVTTIGDHAFKYCSRLTSVEIPNSVTKIGRWAFRGCTSLKSIVIPNSITHMGEGAFSDCSKLTIYCKAKRKPLFGWSDGWNESFCKVVWGHKKN